MYSRYRGVFFKPNPVLLGGLTHGLVSSRRWQCCQRQRYSKDIWDLKHFHIDCQRLNKGSKTVSREAISATCPMQAMYIFFLRWGWGCHSFPPLRRSGKLKRLSQPRASMDSRGGCHYLVGRRPKDLAAPGMVTYAAVRGVNDANLPYRG